MTVLDPQTFTASTLTSSEGLAAALRMLESCLAGPDIHLNLIVQDLCSVPNLFEFILSGEFVVCSSSRHCRHLTCPSSLAKRG